MTQDSKLKTETIDDLLHGELKLIQHRDGYRYSVDALLLAHFALPLVDGKNVLDMGTGAGVIALILARRGRPARVVGVEIQDSLYELASRNAEHNTTSPKVRIIRADATGLGDFKPGSFDVIVTNPPFRKADSGHISPNQEKAAARHELLMNLHDWLFEARRLAAPEGRICMVYPADQKKRLGQTIRKLDLHIARRCRVVDRTGGEAKLILLELSPLPCPTRDIAEVPIETEAGKFSLDGYK